MKNIYIIGIPRSGKTTLSKIIKQKYPQMNIISFEAIRNGFIKTQPNLNMGNRNSKARQEILPKFLIEFAHWNLIISNCGNIIEGSFANIQTVAELAGDDIIICLGLGKRNFQEIILGIQKYDNENDYTKNWTKEQLENHFYDIVENDKENFELCQKYNVVYFDTYHDRDKVFFDILKYIEGQL